MPNPDEIAGLVALLAYGFMARHAFYGRVQRRSEDAGETLIWAAIFSTPLKYVYDHFGASPKNLTIFSLESSDRLKTLSFVGNILASWLVGWLIGVIVINFVRLKRDRKPRELFWPLCYFALRPPRIDLQQEWIQERSWAGYLMLFELKDGRGFAGWVQFYDLSQDRAKDMHVLIRRGYLVDVATGQAGAPLGDEVLIAMSEIKSVRAIKPKVTQVQAEGPLTRISRRSAYLAMARWARKRERSLRAGEEPRR